MLEIPISEQLHRNNSHRTTSASEILFPLKNIVYFFLNFIQFFPYETENANKMSTVSL